MIKEMSLQQALIEYPESKNLILGFGSGMYQVLIGFPNLHSQIKTYLYFNNSNTLIGWSWLIPHLNFQKLRRLIFQIYVKSGNKNRRQGVGTELFLRAQAYACERHCRMVVYPWDTQSDVFFEKMQVLKRNCLDWPGNFMGLDIK